MSEGSPDSQPPSSNEEEGQYTAPAAETVASGTSGEEGTAIDLGSDEPAPAGVPGEVAQPELHVAPTGITDKTPGEAASPVAAETPVQASESPAAESDSTEDTRADVHKAETMAYAEDEFRTKAALNRKIDQNREELSQVEQRQYEISGKLAPVQKFKLGRRQESLRQELTELGDDPLARKAQADTEAQKAFQSDFSPSRQPHSEPVHNVMSKVPGFRARYYDEQASRIGDWAGALHDHPLSEEFLQSHGDLQTDDPEDIPKRLVRIENNGAALERIVTRNEAHPYGTLEQNIDLLVQSNGHSENPRIPSLNELLQYASKEEIEEYSHIIEELQAKAKEMDEFHTRIFDRLETQPLREQLDKIHSLLNDVRRELGLPLEEVEAEPASQDDSPGDEAAPAEEPPQPEITQPRAEMSD